jgi:magnesium chelatase family protein
VNVGFVDLFDKKDSELAERSSKIKRRVLQAREIQKNRFEKLNLKENQKVNAKINGEDLQNFCYLGEDEEAILKSFLNKTQSSMRAITRILRVSRTIADLDGCQNIKSKHLFEAISYRREL